MRLRILQEELNAASAERKPPQIDEPELHSTWSGLRVLITNFDLSSRGGTQLYVRDLALSLLAQGHQPFVYSPLHGSVAHELRAATIPVTDNLDTIQKSPDIIHGNQHVETMTALLYYPRVPAVYFCHSWKNWLEAPPIFPRILRYVAVDDTCYDRLTVEHGIPEAKARVILHGVDVERFKARNGLPASPRRALVFSNYANEQTYLKVIRQACHRSSIELDVIGEAAGNICEHPESELGNYDIVFAKARCALEALAVGTAVILCDAGGAGQMVTMRELDQLRRFNFGIRTLQSPLSVGLIEREIARYDPQDALQVSKTIRATAGHAIAIARVLELYEEVLAEHRRDGKPDLEWEGQAAARYLRQLYADFANHSALTMRWRNRLLKIPVFGYRLASLKQKLNDRPH
ncbi:MAG TPA: glycosyltransferase [Pyrinomonadaceae bacterium]